ncbi:heat shock 70 kDa protein 12B-like [Saccostrea cucullata]|uniref:heat shock 70 kDa protein 12B-like n=1 Tax=Saccostrea cuccullata TaxID=36930 RepID=UPI002ED151A7
MDEKVASKCLNLIVAAIDLGTSYSGYAFSVKHDWGRVMTSIWQGGSLLTHKAPTCLLLKKDQSESYFGYEAEDRYAEHTAYDNKDYENYYFFQNFTMILHEDVNHIKHILCKDIKGYTLEAGTVFMHCIKYLKNHLFDEIKKTLVFTKEEDIDFILTVPAIWGEKAKIFMRKAAMKAGIKNERLNIVLEPEAASIYCQYLQIARNAINYDSCDLGVLRAGTKYILLDLGGGTADITVHQKCEDNTLEEVLPASSGPWGGKSVDDAFIKFLTELVGESAMTTLKQEYIDDYLEIMRGFETKKRTRMPNKLGMTIMHLPISFYSLCAKMHHVKDFKAIIEKNAMHKDNVKYSGGKLKWSNKYFAGFFKKTIDSIVKHIDELFDENEVRDVDIIVMVGCFSECTLVQDAIKKNFEHKKVIVPEEAGLAVVKGAVYFGHIPDASSRRSAQYTYGIQTWPEFRPGFHLESKKVNVSGSVRCKDVFFKLVTKGEKIFTGLAKSQFVQALTCKKNYLECALYISDKKDPVYVDEPECRLIGIHQIPLSADENQPLYEIEESLIFGETELTFRARDLLTGVQREVTFDLLKE